MPRAPDAFAVMRRDPDEKQRTEKERQRELAGRRGTAAERGYDGRWQKARVGYLRKHPLCVAALANGRTVPATVVDHIVPHDGDQRLFWDSDNWQALSEDAHRRIKAVIERRWKLGDVDAEQLRLDRALPEFYVDAV